MDPVMQVAFYQKEDHRLPAAAQIDGKTDAHVVGQRGIDDHKVIRLCRSRPSGGADA